jgi:hypothetical protein
MYLYSERLFHAGFPEFNPGSPFYFSSGSMLVRSMLLFYTFLPEFGRGCNAPFDSKTCKALALLKLDNDFYDNFILGFGQTGVEFPTCTKPWTLVARQLKCAYNQIDD